MPGGEALRPYVLVIQGKKTASAEPLGTSELTGGEMRSKAFNRRYLVRYLLAKWFRGAWREPTFPFSSLGRLFLKEGYSAGAIFPLPSR